MVKVYPGTEDQEALNARGIVKTSKGGVTYYYVKNLNSSSDKRTKSDAMDNINTKFSKASEIWGKKPSCWRDYFQRAWKNFVYDKGGTTDTYTSKKTGFSLAQQLIMNTYDIKKGSYFDPKCFCIQPVLPSGFPMNTYARLYVHSQHVANYEYDEKEKLTTYNDDGSESHFRFRSASTVKYGVDHGEFLENQFCMTRLSEGPYGEEDLSKLRLVPSWPPLALYPHGQALMPTNYLTDFKRWIYDPLPTYQPLSEPEPLVGFRATWVEPSFVGSLCNKDFLYFDIYMNSYKIIITTNYTDNAPFYDVTFADKTIGTFGCGAGLAKQNTFTLLSTDYNPLKAPYMGFMENITVPQNGRQSYHSPSGKTTILTADSIRYVKGSNKGCNQQYAVATFHSEDLINFDGPKHTPGRWYPIYYIDEHTSGFLNAYPTGAISMGVGLDGNITIPAKNYNDIVPIPANSFEICDRNSWFTGQFNFFHILINSTLGIMSGKCNSMIGIPGTDPDDLCPNHPKLENIKIGFLEYDKKPDD